LVDTPLEREWGYAPAHFLAPDMELGLPDGYSWPTANSDLQRLVEQMHSKNIRFISDVVLGFARDGAYQHISFDEFHIDFDPNNPPPDPDAWSSRPGEPRNSWGSELFRYVRETNTYDPTNGTVHPHPPARAWMYTAIDRWMQDFCVDGLRLDSIETVANWDFVGEYTQRARNAFVARCQAQGLSKEEADARFFSVGEELSLPMDLLTQGRVDALWNDKFRQYIRPALFGSNASDEPSFEWTVRNAIDCTKKWGFTKGTQAVNYLTTHDVEGYQKERLCTSFRYAGFSDAEIERRIKLAFACLMTAVGIPMFLAGEEFADENDLFDITGHVTNSSGKQIDPVDFNRLDGDENVWRQRILSVVKALINLRTTHPALAGDQCDFIHTDFTPGRRILAWKRGTNENPVVVVANFSDFESGQLPDSEYKINGWPNPDPGHDWYEVTQARTVPADWAGREPLFRWEAKVYRLA